MASFAYLWKNRTKHSFGSKVYIKSWAKRVLSLPQLLVRNYNRTMLIQKGAKIDPTAELNTFKLEGNKNNLIVGRNSFLGKIEIDLHDTVTIGNNVCINDSVKILTASHEVNSPTWQLIKKPIIINDYVWIAKSAIILPGITIGEGTIVAAGAVVTKSTDKYVVVAGNPAKVINKRLQNLNYNPCEWLAANSAWLR